MDDDDLYDDELDEPTNDKSYDTIFHAVRDALAEHTDKDKKNPLIEAGAFLFGAWLLIVSLDYLSYARWMNKLRYAFWYSAELNQVQQSEDKPPSDCNFLRSPVGDKGCHYKKTMTVEHVITRRDIPTNRPMVSYDEGKTWSWNDGEYPVPPSKTVYVTWEKIEE
jgi:hypothetical protein